MPKDSKTCTFRRDFENVRGEALSLSTAKSDSFARFVLKAKRRAGLKMKSVVLLAVAVFNFISLVEGLLPIMLSAAIFVISVVYFHSLVKSVEQESLTVLKSLGYQISVKYVLGRRTQFIPWNVVQGVFINEVIHRLRIIYVLTILTKDAAGEEKIVPLFTATLPRLQCLKCIYEHCAFFTTEC